MQKNLVFASRDSFAQTGERMRRFTLNLMRISLFGFIIALITAQGLTAEISKGQDIREIQITYGVQNATLKNALQKLQKESGFNVFYFSPKVTPYKGISIPVQKRSVHETLERLLNNTTFTFRQEGKTIILIEKTTPETLDHGSILNENVTEKKIRGKVTDDNGEGLPGVSILIKGTQQGTITDENGNYELSVSNSEAILIFSFVGYQTIEREIGDNDTINIVLTNDIKSLEEIVVVGYGTQRKANLTGAVEMVDSKKLANRPIGNLGQALQGVSPGLNIFTNNSGGQPDATMNFNIRGMGSPLVLVDGLPVDINLINPEDIESISVLKDASSAAIYGANAPYGIILITTKKGKATDGKPRLNYNNTLSMSAPTRLPTPSNSLEFATYMNDATRNAGSSPLFSDEVLDRIRTFLDNPNSIPAVGPDPLDPSKWAKRENANGNTNWYKEILKPWSFRQKHDLSLIGGTENVDYYVSLGLFEHNGQIRYANEGYTRYNIDAKIGTKITNWMRINFLTKFSNSLIDYPNDGYGLDRAVMWHDFSRRFPTDPVKYPNGTWSEMSRFQVFQDGGREKHTTSDFWTKIEFEIEPLTNWQIKADFGWNGRNNISSLHRAKIDAVGPDGTLYTHFDTTPINSLTKTYARNRYWNANIYTSFEKRLDKHSFNILVGHQRESNSADNLSGYRDALLTDFVPAIVLSTGSMLMTDMMSEWATMGTFARLNYSFADKYLIEFNGRYQGSSRFEQGSRFGFFPSVSAAYRISEENFWSPVKNVINDVKLRASYGSLGNHNVANFLYLPIMNVRSQVSWVLGNDPLIGVNAPGLVSSSLTWETISTTNIGIDVSFLKNRLSLTFDAFARNISNMVGTPNPLPSTLGTGVPQENNAAQKNKGWELSIRYNDKIGENLNYFITLGLTDYKTIITKWNNPNKVLSQHYEGKTLGEIWGYTSNGLFKSDEEIATAPKQTRFYGVWNPGDVRYEDLDGNGEIGPSLNTVDQPGDLKIIGNSSPRYLYSLNLNTTYKNFDLAMLWTGVAKQDAWLSDFVFWGHTTHVWGTSVFKEHQDYYRDDNTDAYWPRPYISAETDKNRQVSTRYLQNASYLRLRNISVGYSLNPVLIERLSLSKLRIFINGENLLAISGIQKFLDPEGTGGSWGSGKVYPIQKTLSLGLNVQF